MATTSDLTFTLHSSGTYYIVEAKNRTTISGDVEIPSTFNNLPVTKIDYEAFKDASLITSVSIPDSITYIDSGAFNGCSGLTTVVIPDSVVTCGGMAFANCTGLTSVTLSDSTGVIAANWFVGCSSLTSIHIPKSIYYIVGTAFSGCDALSSITVDDENEYLYVEGNCCITKKYNSKNAVQAKTLALGCKTSVIPSDVLYIGQYAFYGCKELSEISIPSSVSEIKSSAFYNCTGLTSVVIPYGCSVMGYAFYGCSGITYFKLEGKGNKSYGASILGNTTSLTEVCVNADSTGWRDTWQGKPVVKESLYGLIYTVNSDGTAYSVRLKNKSTTGKIIVSSSFSDLPVTEIEASGFINCASITSVTLPATITTVGENSFRGCSSLSFFKLLGDAPEENTGVFDNTPALLKISVYDGKGFGDSWNGKEVVIDYQNLIFTSSGDGTYYYVKAKNTSIECDIFIPSEHNGLPVKYLDENAFTNCNLITSVVFQGTIEAIPASSFSGCSSLESVDLSGVKTINNLAFQNCTGLKSVVFQDSIESVGDSSFSGCSGVESVSVSESAKDWVQNIGYFLKDCPKISTISVISSSSTSTVYAEGNCLVSVDNNRVLLGGSNPIIPSDALYIWNYAFYKRDGVSSVSIPENIISLANYVFYGCPNLKSVTVSSKLEYLGLSVFAECSSLSYIKFNGNAISDVNSVFTSTNKLLMVNINADANGWGDTWGGKPIYRIPDYGIKDKETQIQTVVLGEKTIPNVYLTKNFIHPYIKATGNISLRIVIPSDNTTFQLFEKISVGAGGSVFVRWGDGEIYYSGEKSEATDFTSVKHVYSKAGEYVVKLNGNAFSLIGSTSSQWVNYNPVSNFYPYVNEILSLRFPDNSSGVSMDYAFSGCSNLTGKIPEWPRDVVSASFTYKDCTGLTCSIPEWGENIVNCLGTFIGDKNLTGEIPEWNSVITKPVWTYYQCKNLSGSIPEWTDVIISGQETYLSCTGLTGSIPPWGASMTVALSTYSGCTGLGECSIELIADPMPSRFRSFNHCVSGCASNITKYFKTTWGGTLAA